MNSVIGKISTLRSWRPWMISWRSSEVLLQLYSMNLTMTRRELSRFLRETPFRFWGVGLVRRGSQTLLTGLMLEILPYSSDIRHQWGMDLTFRARAITLYGSEFHGILSTTSRLLLEYTVRGKKVIVYSFITS